VRGPWLGSTQPVVSIWGRSWRHLVAEKVAKKFAQETGVP
jgi:hypothetical protein